MKNITGNLFDQECDAICITTNGFVKSNGECVMGRGCAQEAAKRWPNLPTFIGETISIFGNFPFIALRTANYAVVTFPVKPISAPFNGSNAVAHMATRFKIGDTIPGWACKAECSIIIRSAKRLVELADRNNWKKVFLPRPGCGAGELAWEDVEPLLQEILDDRFYAITFGSNNHNRVSVELARENGFFSYTKILKNE